jgi:hypothetical protein
MIQWDKLIVGEIVRLDEPYDGYVTLSEDGSLWLPLFVVDFDQRGEGLASTFLDELPKDRRVIVPSVINQTFGEMLVRRGFRVALADVRDDVIEVFVRDAEALMAKEGA